MPDQMTRHFGEIRRRLRRVVSDQDHRAVASVPPYLSGATFQRTEPIADAAFAARLVASSAGHKVAV
jgi:hypothetical protein